MFSGIIFEKFFHNMMKRNAITRIGVFIIIISIFKPYLSQPQKEERAVYSRPGGGNAYGREYERSEFLIGRQSQ